ncbi:LacI family transcriptional regulator [Streptomyces griseochromogenes]|uniref:LacI family transcriptional regulator n=1 Tax=Streptomyces griseochromogenes TaxID=68214 RepID=A0A1B1B6G1_9ACTN|nr:LacI family DNA-binding transcriptional regulator [Streptomyces griseochromogenes]ANP54377.1 LacI family transcriptional regulator [Streptomyces griseochromogenes]MBP2053251.1 LacI family transcriptional regulator [Streptomyces griseochromogenes]
MPTMADVARSAGVSVATVSHVLNGTRPVLPHTRQAVLEAVDALGYTPNTLARSLVTSRTRSIGLAVSAISNPYFTEILQGVEAAALDAGYSLLIADPHDDPVHERKVVQLLHERRVDGMIVAPSASPRDLVAYLSRHAVPTVFLDRVLTTGDRPTSAPHLDQPSGDHHGDGSPSPGRPCFDQVCAESTGPTARLVTHLAGLGHRRIGLVTGLPGLSTTSERITGYRQAVADAGLALDEDLVVSGNSESAGAERATATLLSLPAPPTALVTANNAMTIGALRALRRQGLVVPDDMALCCFDDFAWADLFSPRLTAIAQPSREIGAQAVQVLLDRLAAPDRPARTVRLPCAFVHRTSCGCPEGRDQAEGPGPDEPGGRTEPSALPEKGTIS